MVRLAVRSVVRSLIGGLVAVVVRWSSQRSQSMFGRWSGQWYGPVVRLTVRSGVWYGGPVSGPVGGLDCGLVDGPVCGPVRAVCGLSKHVLLHTIACRLQMLGYWSQGACVLFNLCNSQKPGPGSAHTLPTKCGPRCFLGQVVEVRASPHGNCFRI